MYKIELYIGYNLYSFLLEWYYTKMKLEMA